MRSKIAALLATLVLGLAALVALAVPAQAACPTLKDLDARVSYGASVWVQARTRVVDCGGYYRLQSMTYTDSASVDYLGSSAAWGTPSVHWHSYGSSGPIVNRVVAYVSWYSGSVVQLGNQKCYKPCSIEFDGTVRPQGNVFHLYWDYSG